MYDDDWHFTQRMAEVFTNDSVSFSLSVFGRIGNRSVIVEIQNSRCEMLLSVLRYMLNAMGCVFFLLLSIAAIRKHERK